MIWDFAISFSNVFTESTISAASMLRNTFVMTFAPALSNAFALSYSQFVPGNTGINTVGCAILCPQITMSFVSYSGDSTFSSEASSDTVRNTCSRVPVHASSASFSVISVSPNANFASSVTSPITV